MRRAQETGKELAYEAVRQALDSSNMRIEDIDSVALGTAPDAFDGVHMKGEYLLDGAGARGGNRTQETTLVEAQAYSAQFTDGSTLPQAFTTRV